MQVSTVPSDEYNPNDHDENNNSNQTFGIGSAILDDVEDAEEYPELEFRKFKGKGKGKVKKKWVWNFNKPKILENGQNDVLHPHPLYHSVKAFPRTIRPCLQTPNRQEMDVTKLHKETARFFKVHYPDISIPHDLLLTEVLDAQVDSLPIPPPTIQDEDLTRRRPLDYPGNTLAKYEIFETRLLAWSGGTLGNELYVTFLESSSQCDDANPFPMFKPSHKPQTSFQTRIEQIYIEEYISTNIDLDEMEPWDRSSENVDSGKTDGEDGDGEDEDEEWQDEYMQVDGETNERRFVVGVRCHSILGFVFSDSCKKTIVHSSCMSALEEDVDRGNVSGDSSEKKDEFSKDTANPCDFCFIPGSGGREAVVIDEKGSLWKVDTMNGTVTLMHKGDRDIGPKWLSLPSIEGNWCENVLWADEESVQIWDQKANETTTLFSLPTRGSKEPIHKISNISFNSINPKLLTIATTLGCLWIDWQSTRQKVRGWDWKSVSGLDQNKRELLQIYNVDKHTLIYSRITGEIVTFSVDGERLLSEPCTMDLGFGSSQKSPWQLSQYRKSNRTGIASFEFEKGLMIFESWSDGGIYQSIFKGSAVSRNGTHVEEGKKRVCWSKGVKGLESDWIRETLEADFGDKALKKTRNVDWHKTIQEVFQSENPLVGMANEGDGATGLEILRDIQSEHLVVTGRDILAFSNHPNLHFDRDDISPFLPVSPSITTVASITETLQSTSLLSTSTPRSLPTPILNGLPTHDEERLLERFKVTEDDKDLADSIKEMCIDVTLAKTVYQSSSPLSSLDPQSTYTILKPTAMLTPASRLLMEAWTKDWNYKDPYSAERIQDPNQAKVVKIPKEVQKIQKGERDTFTFGSASQIVKPIQSQPPPSPSSKSQLTQSEGGLYKISTNELNMHQRSRSKLSDSWQNVGNGPFKPIAEELDGQTGQSRPAPFHQISFSQPVIQNSKGSQSQSQEIGPFTQPEAKPPPRKKRKAGF